jgi:putative membrane protein
MTRKIVLIAPMLLFLLACSRGTSQEAHPLPASSQDVARSVELASQDRDFIEQAAQGDNAEIAIAALVEGRALRAEVTSLGRMVRSDHEESKRQLEAIAAARHIALPTSLGEQQATYDRVIDKRLDPFDREFVRAMIETHQDALQLFRNEATGGVDRDLKAFAASSVPKLEAHLQAATALASLAQAPQELTTPPTADAVQTPPASSFRKEPDANDPNSRIDIVPAMPPASRVVPHANSSAKKAKS